MKPVQNKPHSTSTLEVTRIPAACELLLFSSQNNMKRLFCTWSVGSGSDCGWYFGDILNSEWCFRPEVPNQWSVDLGKINSEKLQQPTMFPWYVFVCTLWRILESCPFSQMQCSTWKQLSRFTMTHKKES